MSKDTILNEIRSALKKVMDPEIGIDIVSAGFVRDVRIVDENIVEIDLMLTTPFCPLSNWIAMQAKRAAESVKGVKKARVRIVGFGIPDELKRLLKLP